MIGFPDQLWTEFGRLTNWKGATNSQRPKYWGNLVMELVYGYDAKVVLALIIGACSSAATTLAER